MLLSTKSNYFHSIIFVVGFQVSRSLLWVSQANRRRVYAFRRHCLQFPFWVLTSFQLSISFCGGNQVSCHDTEFGRRIQWQVHAKDWICRVQSIGEWALFEIHCCCHLREPPIRSPFLTTWKASGSYCWRQQHLHFSWYRCCYFDFELCWFPKAGA